MFKGLETYSRDIMRMTNPNQNGPKKIWVPKKKWVTYLLQVPKKRKNKWYLDNGCSRHMTGDPLKFINLERIKGENVSFGGNNKGKIIGKRTIKIDNLIINEVSLVKGLNFNLISISQLCDIGYRITFQEDKCSGISKDNKQSFTGWRHGNIYLLDAKSNNLQCLVFIKEEYE